MFDVYDSEKEISRKIYSVLYKNGYPFFTFYEDGQWITKSAKYFIPLNNRVHLFQ